MPRTAKQPVSTRRRYVVDWTVSGSFEVEAVDAEEAQQLFDDAWESPSRLNPRRDGEVQNDAPYLKGSD